MKMNNLLMPTAAAASLLFLDSCGEDKETPSASDNSDFLIGEWELVSVDGEKSGENYSYNLVFKFESDGDFTFCYDYVNKIDPSENYEDCYEGDWQWITKGEELAFSFMEEEEDGDGNIVTIEVEVNFEITKLTATELEGTWEMEGEVETYEVVLKKN